MLHGHNNTFIGIFQKDCCKLLLRNIINYSSTCKASRKGFTEQVYAGSVPDPIFLNIAGLAAGEYIYWSSYYA